MWAILFDFSWDRPSLGTISELDVLNIADIEQKKMKNLESTNHTSGVDCIS